MASVDRFKQRKFAPGELILSEATEDDLISLAEGYYQSFGPDWFDMAEPPHLRHPDISVRVERFAVRMKPWLGMSGTRWTIVKISPLSPDYDPSRPDRVIGHAGWLLPERTKSEVFNLWRVDASDRYGWRERMGWTEQYEEELWSGTDRIGYTKKLSMYDELREARMGGIGHWHLAPLWVVPDYQGRGVASVLLRDGIDLADSTSPRPPMYLESAPGARKIYAHFGYEDVEGEGEGYVMIRNAPEGMKFLQRKLERPTTT